MNVSIIFDSLLNNSAVEEKINSKKNEVTVETDQLFHLLITGCKDSGSFFYRMPLDIVAKILENGFTMEEIKGISQWIQPKNLGEKNFFDNHIAEERVNNTDEELVNTCSNNSFMHLLTNDQFKHRKAFEESSSDCDSSWGD